MRKDRKHLSIGVLSRPDLKDMAHIKQILKEIERDTDVTFHTLENTQYSPPPLPPPASAGGAVTMGPPPLHSTHDFILSFGGDGTMLRTLPYATHYDAPVLGINLGKLGFLTDISLKELKASISDLRAGKYTLETRMLLDVKVQRENKLLLSETALNDAVLYKGSEAKLVKIRLYANRQFVYETRSDGMVVSTPTGATAYSLAAGGPIASPAMQAIIITPLNPHILTVRPMIFDDTQTIELKLPTASQVHLQLDGINICSLAVNDRIVVKKAPKSIKFVKLSHKSFYKTLRRKLKMGKI